MGKKISELSALTDSQVADNTRVLALADPITGIAGKATVPQLRLTLSLVKYLYTAVGTEGTSIVIFPLSGKNILLITREAGALYEVVSSPASTEYSWDGATITLGAATSPGERFNILYANL